MIPYKKIAFHTLGCKLNFSETSTLARQFTEAGYAKVEMDEDPNVLVINTCSVTDHADKKCRNIVSRAVRNNPGVFVAVVGCYAQLKPDAIAAIPGVKMVVGAGEKFNLLAHVESYLQDSNPIILHDEIKNVKTFEPSFSSGDRTRTFLKIQDGCNYFCSFCTIPLARGRSRSGRIDSTIAEAKKAIALGALEIVLTGVNIGDFGTQHGETLLELLKELENLDGVKRYRISSIEPNLLSDEIIEFVASSKKFMPHFHIPLQSGSDEILRSMRRRYRTELYKQRVDLIHALMPHACIGVDVITGFPGETERHFLETKEFLQSLPISYLHVFSYSERDKTTALRIEESVSIPVRHQRTAILRMLSEKIRTAFYKRHFGDVREVLWESDSGADYIKGFTDNYIQVKGQINFAAPNTISDVQIGQLDGEGNCVAISMTEPIKL